MARFTNIVQLFGIRTTSPSAVTGPVGEGTPILSDDQGHLWVRVRGDVRVTNSLSGSTNGRPILLTSGDQTLHTATNTANEIDQVWLWLTNTDTTTRTITIHWGGTASTDDLIFQVSPQDTVVAVAGLVLKGGLEITGEADLVDVINVTGFVETVTTS